MLLFISFSSDCFKMLKILPALMLDTLYTCETKQNQKHILNILFKIFTSQSHRKPFLKAKPRVLYSATHTSIPLFLH